MSTPLISVIMTFHNSAHFIRKSIESALNQTHKNIQLILIDDGSTDCSVQIVSEFSDPRIELFQLPENRHIAYATNVGFTKVKGEYTAILDSDDLWYPEKLEKQLQYLNEHPEKKGCFTWVDLIDENDRIINEKLKEFHAMFNTSMEDEKEFLRYFFFRGNFLNNPSALFATEALEAVGFHNLFYIQATDFEWWVRFAKRFSFGIVKEPLIRYRRVQNSNQSVSRSSEIENIRFYNEWMHIRYHFFDDMDDAVFIRTFRDYFRCGDSSTPLELTCEKAFLIASPTEYSPNISSLGLTCLEELLGRPETALLLKEKYGFSTIECGAQTGTHLYYDPELETELRSLKGENEYSKNIIKIHEQNLAKMSDDFLNSQLKIQQQESHLTYLSSELKSSREAGASLREQVQILTERVNNADEQIRLHTEAARQHELTIETLNSELNSITNSHIWKMSAPVRRLLDKTKKKTPKLILIYAYLVGNLGDDLFVHLLCRRYPQTQFILYADKEYLKRFQGLKNCQVVSSENDHDGFYGKYIEGADAVIHIGGSCFIQQEENWSTPYHVDCHLAEHAKKLYFLGGNFGPYSDENYYRSYHELFRKYAGLCFRDHYSAGLFSDLPNTAYAPDIVFTYPPKNCRKRKKVVFAPILLSERNGKFGISSYADAYRIFHREAIRAFLRLGYDVSLVSFCKFQGDEQSIHEICRELTVREQASVSCVYYKNELKPVMSEFESAECVVATRFHSMILGFVHHCKVLPIIYDRKMQTVLEDLSYPLALPLSELQNVDIEATLKTLISMFPIRTDALKSEASKQFQFTDAFLQP